MTGQFTVRRRYEIRLISRIKAHYRNDLYNQDMLEVGVKFLIVVNIIFTLEVVSIITDTLFVETV